MALAKHIETRYDAETVDTRPIQKVIGSHKFKIMGHSWDKDMGKGESIKFRIFSVGGYNWMVEFYPNGDDDALDKSVSIYLYLMSKVQRVSSEVSFAILDLNGNALPVSRKTMINTFENVSSYKGFTTKEKLESIIKDDCFVIKSVVTVFKVLPVKRSPPITVPPSNITHQLSYLLETGTGADVTFDVNGTTFNAHKCILVAQSPVFLAQFFGPMKENTDTVIKIEEMDVRVFKRLLHFIYDDSFPNSNPKRRTNAAKNKARDQWLSTYWSRRIDRVRKD